MELDTTSETPFLPIVAPDDKADGELKTRFGLFNHPVQELVLPVLELVGIYISDSGDGGRGYVCE